MSSPGVRTALQAAIEAAAGTLPVFDLSDYVSADEVLTGISAEALLIQYVTADEEQVTIGGEGNQGWREVGTVVLHLVVPTGFDSAPAIAKGDAIRLALRGKRVDASLVVEACEPFRDFGSDAIGNEGGAWKYWSSNLLYERDDCG